MGTIDERKYDSGTVRYRVRLRSKGYLLFSITFDDYDEACSWMEKNEEEFYKNPEKYINWKKKLHKSQIRERLRIKDHIVMPKVKFFTQT